MTTQVGAARPSPPRRAGPRPLPATVSYDAAVGVLTVALGDAGRTDRDEVVDGLFTAFDSSELGRLVTLQALLPPGPPAHWRLLLADHLGASLAQRCLALVDAEEDAIGLAAEVPAAEWRRLRGLQWPALHRACRAPAGGPGPDAPPLEVPWSGSFLTAAEVAAASDDPAGALVAALTLPAALAAAAEVDERLQVTVRGRAVVLEVGAHWKSHPGPLSATVLSPEPRSAQPVRFQREGKLAHAAIELADPLEGPATVLVHLEADAGPSAVLFRTFLLTLRERSGAVRELVGARTPLAAGTGYSGARRGRVGEHVSWPVRAKAPVEVEVLREGGTLWAQGFATKSRRRQLARVECVLRPDAVAALRPGGSGTPEAGVLSATGRVADDGSFQVELARVETGPYAGELLERLELHIG
jgi:hypothetical protein